MSVFLYPKWLHDPAIILSCIPYHRNGYFETVFAFKYYSLNDRFTGKMLCTITTILPTVKQEFYPLKTRAASASGTEKESES